MTEETFGTAMRQLRGGMSLRELGRRSNLSKSYLSRLENDQQHPPASTAAVLDRVLDAQGRLVALAEQADTGHPPAWPLSIDDARAAVVMLWSDDTDAAAADMSTMATRNAAWQWLITAEDTSVAHEHGWRRIGANDITRLRGVRHHLKAIDNAHGGGAALPMAISYLRREVTPVLEGRYDDTTGRGLMDVVAELKLDVAWMAYDAGSQRFAQNCFVQALRLSHAAGNRLLGGRILAAMSHQALHLGQVSHAVDLARAARAGTERLATPRAVAMLAAMEACAQASRGDTALCEAALGAAEHALAQAADDDPDPGWLDFDEGGLWGHAARSCRDLQQVEKAERYAARSVDLCLRDHGRTRAQRTAIQATVSVQLGNLDQAAEMGMRILADAWNLHSSHVYGDVARLAGLIGPSGATRDFIDQAREYLTARAPTGPE